MGFHHCYDNMDEDERHDAIVEIARTLKVSTLKEVIASINVRIEYKKKQVHADRKRKKAQKKEAKRQKIDAGKADKSSDEEEYSSDDSGVSLLEDEMPSENEGDKEG